MVCINNQERITIKARAKINLALDILSKREDGYHNVKMIMQSVDLYDILKINMSNGSGIIINSNKYMYCDDKDNLMYVAAEKFLSKVGIVDKKISIDIEKNIPIQAGLAGGSTDAAAVLYGLNTLCNRLSFDQLIDMGSSLGADVPFCLLGGTCIAEGIGTTLKKIDDMPLCYLLIVKPSNINISTKQAYALSDEFKIGPNKEKFNAMIDGIKNQDLNRISSNLFNKFQDIMNLKKINKIIEKLRKSGALNACMTGSGSAVYGIFENIDLAMTCKNNFDDCETFLVESSNKSLSII